MDILSGFISFEFSWPEIPTKNLKSNGPNTYKKV